MRRADRVAQRAVISFQPYASVLVSTQREATGELALTRFKFRSWRETRKGFDVAVGPTCTRNSPEGGNGRVRQRRKERLGPNEMRANESKERTVGRSMKKWLSAPLEAFILPVGYPGSVTPDYGEFIIWNICRNLFRKSHYVMGTSALLVALGIGKSTALPISATLNWVLKDGLGMGAKVIISSRLAPIVDRDAKRWRFIGDFLMTIASCIEMLSPLHPSSFLIFGSMSSLIRQAADAMSGPSYRVILHSFATHSNIGDVSSRAEIQVVIGNLLGLALGVLSSAALSDLPAYFTSIVFLSLTALHLLSTYNSIRPLQLRTLNQTRLNHITKTYIATHKIPSIPLTNSVEPILSIPTQKSSPVITIGSSPPHRTYQLASASINPHAPYIISYNRQNNELNIIPHLKICTSNHLLRAYFQTQYIVYNMGNSKNNDEIRKLINESFEYMEKEWVKFERDIKKADWEITRLLIPVGKWRYGCNGFSKEE